MYEAVNSALNAWWSYKASTKNPVVYRIESENGMSVKNLYQWFTSLPMGKVLKRHKPWLSIIFHISELFTKFFNYLEPGIVLDVLLSYKDFQHFVLSILYLTTPSALCPISYKHSPYTTGSCLYGLNPRAAPSDVSVIEPNAIRIMIFLMQNHLVNSWLDGEVRMHLYASHIILHNYWSCNFAI